MHAFQSCSRYPCIPFAWCFRSIRNVTTQRQKSHFCGSSSWNSAILSYALYSTAFEYDLFSFAPDVEGDQFSLPRWEALLKYKVIVSSCLDADILVRTWCTNEFISSIEGRVLSTLHPHSSRSIRPHWTHLVIDEVRQ